MYSEEDPQEDQLGDHQVDLQEADHQQEAEVDQQADLQEADRLLEEDHLEEMKL